MKRIVLTGNIASGKSTAAEYLKQQGKPVLSADACVHDLITRQELQTEIKRHLDPHVRKTSEKWTSIIRDQVFGSPPFQKWYIPWIHGHVATTLQAQMARLEQQPPTPDLLFLDIPLFFESAHRWLRPDQVWLVWTPRWLRELRWAQRFRASKVVMDKISAWQIPDEEKFQKVDIILVNTLEKSYLGKQILNALTYLT